MIHVRSMKKLTSVTSAAVLLRGFRNAEVSMQQSDRIDE